MLLARAARRGGLSAGTRAARLCLIVLRGLRPAFLQSALTCGARRRGFDVLLLVLIDREGRLTGRGRFLLERESEECSTKLLNFTLERANAGILR